MWEVEAGGSWDLGQPELHSKNLSKERERDVTVSNLAYPYTCHKYLQCFHAVSYYITYICATQTNPSHCTHTKHISISFSPCLTHTLYPSPTHTPGPYFQAKFLSPVGASKAPSDTSRFHLPDPLNWPLSSLSLSAQEDTFDQQGHPHPRPEPQPGKSGHELKKPTLPSRWILQ
jgi:hypothetical protein